MATVGARRDRDSASRPVNRSIRLLCATCMQNCSCEDAELHPRPNALQQKQALFQGSLTPQFMHRPPPTSHCYGAAAPITDIGSHILAQLTNDSALSCNLCIQLVDWLCICIFRLRSVLYCEF
jgi:hypothetical protein